MRKVGYNFLIEHFELLVPPLTMHVYQGEDPEDVTRTTGQYKIKILAKSKTVGSSIPDQIAAAIKYEGIRLVYLYPIFEKIDTEELAEYINDRPNAKLRRAIWYLYEWLMEVRLDVPDSNSRYMELLDEKYYFTAKEGHKDQRTRVINNCIGNKKFCPVVRKTKALEKWAKVDMMQLKQNSLEKLSDHLNTEILGRSVTYLYTKETKSSTEIEKEDTTASKTQKFFRVLKSSGTIELSKQRLLFIQNQIVNGPLKDTNYRNQEIYVGETRHTKNGPEENIHYIGPTFEEVPSLMRGLLEMHEKLMLEGDLPPLIHAAILSFGLVYIHPFSDGNGRVHRYLIHDVLKARSPNHDDLIIPVSAAILNHSKEYDAVLEKISKPIMAMMDFDLVEEDNSIIINNPMSYLYRYPDFTDHVIFLYEMMGAALKVDLLQEIIFILKFDKIKKQINDRYDLENKELDLLVKRLLQNEGAVSNRVRRQYSKYFDDDAFNFVEKTAIEITSFFDGFLTKKTDTEEESQISANSGL